MVSTRRAGLVDQQDRNHNREESEHREPAPTDEPTTNAVLLQHAIRERCDREVRCDGAEPEPRREECGPPVLP